MEFDKYTKEQLIEIVKNLKRQKKFGLVWEDKSEKVAEECKEKLPVLTEVGEKYIHHGNGDDPTHIIIEGDNYHALSVLNYTHAGKIDCIYIDPPYNNGERTWKYNNNYIDKNDVYAHSKWLSMIDRRLKLAKRLLNPNRSSLIFTIDEKEYLRVGLLLEELFPNARIQMISSIINRHGTARANEFNRTNEFIFFVMIGDVKLGAYEQSKSFSAGKTLHWHTLRRPTASNTRDKTKTQFYPIYVDVKTLEIKKIGDPIPLSVDIATVKAPEGQVVVFPVRDDGREMMWGVTSDELKKRLEGGFVRVTKYTPDKPQKCIIQFLQSGLIDSINKGEIKIDGYAKDGSIIAHYETTKTVLPTTQWNYSSHDARDYGTYVLKEIMGGLEFDFPKSLYAVRDCIRFATGNIPNAVVLDFFAGSGTTMQAVNLLNREDGNHRQCILSTNNEISYAEEKELRARGLKEGDPEWEALGVANHVTWPRAKCTIEGHDIFNKPLTGNYLDTDIPKSEGFSCNVRYFRTNFISNSDTKDKLRRELCPACEDMIRMREGAYEKIIDEELLKVYKNDRGLTAIIYDRFELDKYIKRIDEIETSAPVHLYVFSYDANTRQEEISEDTKHEYECQPIPEGVLQIYKKIFKNRRVQS